MEGGTAETLLHFVNYFWKNLPYEHPSNKERNRIVDIMRSLERLVSAFSHLKLIRSLVVEQSSVVFLARIAMIREYFEEYEFVRVQMVHISFIVLEKLLLLISKDS